MLKTSRFLHSVLCIVDVKAETSWFIITRCVVNIVLSLCIQYMLSAILGLLLWFLFASLCSCDAATGLEELRRLEPLVTNQFYCFRFCSAPFLSDSLR
jgi:hypothetical protein